MLCRRGGGWIVDSTAESSNDREKQQITETFKARRRDSLVVVQRRVNRDTP